jgi:hypothetical protein
MFFFPKLFLGWVILYIYIYIYLFLSFFLFNETRSELP